MNNDLQDRRGSFLHLLAVGAALAALIAVVLVIQTTSGWKTAVPLKPSDSLSLWRASSEDEKRVTAEVIVDELRAAHVLGPQTSAKLDQPGGKKELVDALILKLDEATNPDVTAYVSPGDTMIKTAEEVAPQEGWDQ